MEVIQIFKKQILIRLNNGTINNIVINNYGHEKAMTEKEVQKLINIAMKKINDINSNPWED